MLSGEIRMAVPFMQCYLQVMGVNLGDELLCHSLSMQNITTVADAVRAVFPHVVIWWNECGHTVATSPEDWAAHPKIPASVTWFSIDFPYALATPANSPSPVLTRVKIHLRLWRPHVHTSRSGCIRSSQRTSPSCCCHQHSAPVAIRSQRKPANRYPRVLAR